MTPETYSEVLRLIKPTESTDPASVATCGTCGFAWDDSVVTSITPAPAGRCPNEYNHTMNDDTTLADEYTRYGEPLPGTPDDE